jgi:SAM-dependent methyltransferase
VSASSPVDGGLHPNIAQAAESWRSKPSLREVYRGLYGAISSRVPKGGRVLEIGAGSGHSREFFSNLDVVRLDVLPAPWIDIVADAHDIPLPDESVDAIVMLDVLHHLSDPPKFFAEAERILRPGGRCIMVEPGITPASGIVFRFFHEEPVLMRADPLTRQNYGADKDPFDSNQAIPTLLFKHSGHRREFERRFPNLRIIEARRMSLFAYPMTGGFQPWTLLSASMVRALLGVEPVLEPILGWAMAFRLLVTLEKGKVAPPESGMKLNSRRRA